MLSLSPAGELVGNGDGTRSRTGRRWREDHVDVAEEARNHGPAIVGLSKIRSADNHAANRVSLGRTLVDVGRRVCGTRRAHLLRLECLTGNDIWAAARLQN